ncbi:MAG: sodium:solute symporter family protein [Calditrichaeota bacterium]|nr:sodium:solute symporter family protein [Calditrichota bacterium]
MYLFGLHILDVAVIVLYVVIIIWLGKRAGQKTKDTGDFYLAGRKLGKVYQFFLNFGCSTNADQAVAVSREIYRQGIGGMWIQYLVLFLTPFYWFTTLLYRRIRLTTVGDYFTDRFKSEFLGASYAVFTLLMAVIGGGVGYMVAGKTLMALTPKTYEECTVQEQRSITQFNEYQKLKSDLDDGVVLSPEQKTHYDKLNDLNKHGQLHSFVSHTNPVLFYFVYAIIVAIYTMLGGFRAAAITDAIQGVLMIIFSLLLIPLGLSKIGGFSGLHASVPAWMFELFGTASISEYAWYTILAMVLANLVSIIAGANFMATAGSAKDEMTARVGMLGGMFFKRFIMLFWALAGLLAIGLYAGKINDPDLIWGFMTRDLLTPGAIGLMLAGILAANMSTLDASSVSFSALFIRNLYQPFVKNKSEKHYMNVGRVVIAVTLLGGIGAAIYVGNLLDLFKYFISIPAIFGASIWLGFIWRRLSRWAVILQVFICLTIYAIIPNVFQALDWAKTNDAFLLETKPKIVTVTTSALTKDVQEGRAEFVGQPIKKQHTIEPAGVFFDKVARINPDDPNSPKIGLKRFNAEIWVMSWFGIDFTNFSKAQLVATRFFFDALFPFLLLFIFTIFTKPVEKGHLDRFFARMHTPVQPTLELDAQAVEESYKDPGKWEKFKIKPGSSWEIMKPTKLDAFGFGGSWVLVGVIIVLLWVMISIK